ncbi:MAG: 6-phosphofructokinase, partial [Clostridia bacterium]|nr:6-phosphofructokinase [Clostridia bacterium]
KTIKEETKVDIKITHLGHTQRGGSPTMADRLLAAKFAVKAVDLLIEGQTNRTVGIVDNHIIDKDIIEAVSMKHTIDAKLHEIAQIISL